MSITETELCWKYNFTHHYVKTFQFHMSVRSFLYLTLFSRIWIQSLILIFKMMVPIKIRTKVKTCILTSTRSFNSLIDIKTDLQAIHHVKMFCTFKITANHVKTFCTFKINALRVMIWIFELDPYPYFQKFCEHVASSPNSRALV